MRTKLLGSLAGIAALGVIGAGFITNSAAQSDSQNPPVQGAPPGPGRGGPTQPGLQGPGQPPQGPGPGPMMMGGGGAAMVVDGDFLYIVQGNRIFKVRKSNLEVAATGQLGMGRPAGGSETKAGG